MPDLEHTLQGHDLGFLRIVAGGWGIELTAPDAVTALPVVIQGISEHNDFAEVVEALPDDAKRVLQALIENEGRMPWAAFVRKFGDVRRMGPARRDRERPDRKPATAAEVLWYRGLLGRAFLNLPPEHQPQEYAYIPDDLLPLLPSLRGDSPPPLGRPATPVEAAQPLLASDAVLDHVCTLLAALRLRMTEDALQTLALGGMPPSALRALCSAANLLDGSLPHPERTRAFLEAPRAEALAQLARAWMEASQFNELRMLPGLKFEGDWRNDPLQTRRLLLDLVGTIPENRWWSLNALVSSVHEQQPDFQRPAGDYDSWFIRRAGTDTYLRGFAVWDEVDGALLRFLICGPLHWLGFVDLARPAVEEDAPISAFRLTPWAGALWHGNPPEGLQKETAKIKMSADGEIRVPARAPRTVRYQVARFCQWETDNRTAADGKETGYYRYRVTPAALERAGEQGLRPTQLLNLLRRFHDGPLPGALAQAIERWEGNGTQARIEQTTLLRVRSAEILAALRKTRAARWLGETLNETTILVQHGAEEQVLAMLAEIGYLAEIKTAVEGKSE